MLLEAKDAWERAMKAAAAFHDLGMIQAEIRRNESALKAGIDEIKEIYGSNYGIAVLKSAFRVLTVSSLEEEIDLVRSTQSKIYKLEVLRERLDFLNKKKSQVFSRTVLPSWLYLLLRRSPEIRHLR